MPDFEMVGVIKAIDGQFNTLILIDSFHFVDLS